MPDFNIVFVFSDQHRQRSLGCYGDPGVRTPNFDAFAREAVCFDNCLSNSPLCVPARGTLLTAQLPLQHGAIGNDLPIRQDVTSVAHVLNHAGYHTGYVGKWHLAGVPRDQFIHDGPGRLGFTEWKAANCTHDYLNSYYDDEEDNRHPIVGYEPTTQTDLAIDFISRNQNRKPWALWLSWGPPHDPYHDVPKQWLDLYSPDEIELAANVRFPVNLNGRQYRAEPELRKAIQGYYAHISALDHEFGRLLTALERTGQTANTLVVYTSDHGDMLGSHGLMNKQLPYEESVKVPLLIRCPGNHALGRRRQLIGLSDLAPTVLGTVGLSFPKPVHGRNFSSLLHDPKAPGRESVYLIDYTACHQSCDRGTPAWRALRTEKHLLAKTCTGDPWMFFDIQQDPEEMQNLLDTEYDHDTYSTLSHQLDQAVATDDAYLEPEPLIQKYGLTAEWNRSQNHFSYPLIP
jgi:arylsulfatase A-like enzyme